MTSWTLNTVKEKEKEETDRYCNSIANAHTSNFIKR